MKHDRATLHGAGVAGLGALRCFRSSRPSTVRSPGPRRPPVSLSCPCRWGRLQSLLVQSRRGCHPRPCLNRSNSSPSLTSAIPPQAGPGIERYTGELKRLPWPGRVNMAS